MPRRLDCNPRPRSGLLSSYDQPLAPRAHCNGYNSTAPVATSVRIHHFISYHLSVLHDWSRCLAGGVGGAASLDRAARLSVRIRVLAEDLWCRVRPRCRVGHRDGLSVRLQLERTGTIVW